MEGTEASLGLQSAVVKRDTCAVCQGFGEEDNPRGKVESRFPGQMHYYFYIHYPNLVVLDQSARNGCQVCSYLMHELKRHTSFETEWDKAIELERTRVGSFDIDRDTAEAARLAKRYNPGGIKPDRSIVFFDNDIDRDAAKAARLAKRYNPNGITRMVWIVYLTYLSTSRDLSHMALGNPRDDLQFRLRYSSLSVWSHFVNVRADPIDPDPPTQDLLSDAHTHLVHRWMKNCDEKHEKCRLVLGQSQKLPKRLLEITSNPVTREITKVRLIETTASSKGIYACLSYCWGRSAQVYKTTRSNLRQYLELIPFNNLPGTIIDTLKLCCKLGFRYVWVDSLCIIQGDKDDWEREASKMAEIYGNSNLTLAIHLCEDSSESFLQKRQQPECQFLGKDIARIAYTDKHTEEERLIYMWRMNKDDVSSNMGGHVNLTWGRNAWLDRAWTFQEWILSPRVLHIHHITQWDCLEGRSDEIHYRFPEEKDPVHRPRSLLDKNWTWSSIVVEFTRRKISKDEDRLPALAGLARIYRDATGYEYLAGMWREQLPCTLLWEKKGRNYLKSPAGFRAPSWSWASLEGEVHMLFQSDESVTIYPWVASVISVECTYWPRDTLSTVMSAWLDIEGPMSLVTERAIDQDDTVFICNDDFHFDGDLLSHWIVNLDQDTCSTEDLAQSKIYLFKIVGSMALVLEKMGQSGGKDAFKRRGYACLHVRRVWIVRYGLSRLWEKKPIRLV